MELIMKTNNQRVIDRMEECLEMVKPAFPYIDFYLPNISYSLKGSTAGLVDFRTETLKFNEVLLNENLEAFITDTVAHEMAHWIDHLVYDSYRIKYDINGKRIPTSCHGIRWKEIMGILGQEPNRCHSYKTNHVKRRTRRYSYVCSSCNHKLGIAGKMHKNIQENPVLNAQNHALCDAEIVWTGASYLR